MFACLSVASQMIANPPTGDSSGTVLKWLIVVGAICVVAVIALVLIPHFMNKEDRGDDEQSAEPEIEEINEE